MAVSYFEHPTSAIEPSRAGRATTAPASLNRSSRGTVRALAVLLVASLAVPTVLFAVAAWQNHELLLEEGAIRAQRTVAVLEQQAAATFQLYEQVFDRVEERLAAGGAADPEALQSYLTKLDDGLDQIDGIFLVEADGHVSMHSRVRPVPAGINVSDRDYFQLLRQAGDDAIAVGEPVIGHISGKRNLNISHRRTLPGGGFGGIIAVTVSDGYFEKFHRTLRASPTDAQTLLRDDGVFLARSPDAPNAPRGIPTETFRKMIATAGNGIYRMVSPADHLDRLYAFRKLAGYPVYVAYGLDTTEIMSRWQRNSILYGAIAGPAALVLFTVTWIALLRARREETAARRLGEEMQQREAAEDALRQAQKMEAVGQLTGGVAHDFNHLLAVIATNIELGASLSESAAARERLDAGLRAVDRGHQITQRLLAFSRRRPLRTAATDLRQKLPELLELVEPSIGREVSLRIEAAPDLWPVEIDDGELQIALLNLVVNARDAMPDGGSVRISARNATLPAGARAAALRELPDEVVVITVADAGQGIPPAIRDRVFEPFFTTKVEGKGSGLGLAQVYGFAKQSNGAVMVESEVGRGTIFTLYLPRATGAASANAARPPVRVASPARAETGPLEGQPRILVVDDEADGAEATAAALARLGCRVTVADRGRRALTILAEDAAYDLVFSDIAMPDGMNGIELAAVIEHRHPGLPVLLTTGNVQRERLAAAAGREVLPKPYTIAALRAALERNLRDAPSSEAYGT